MDMMNAFQEAARLYRAATDSSSSGSVDPAVQAVIHTAESQVCPYIGNRTHHRDAAPQMSMDEDDEPTRIDLARAMCGCRLSALIMIELVRMLMTSRRIDQDALYANVRHQLAAVYSSGNKALAAVLMSGFMHSHPHDERLTALTDHQYIASGLYLAMIVRWVDDVGWQSWTPYHTFVLGINDQHNDQKAYVLSTWLNSDCAEVIPAQYSTMSWDTLRSDLLRQNNGSLKRAFGRGLELGEYQVYLYRYFSPAPAASRGGRKRRRRPTRRKCRRGRRKPAHRRRTRTRYRGRSRRRRR